MFVIETGFIEVTHYVENEPFVLEKLQRGSIINHRSFLLADENDTDGRCGSTVSAYILEYSDLEKIRNKNAELDNEIKKIETLMLGAENPIALDYIIKHPPEKRKVRSFEKETKRNELTVRLKNSIMF